LRRAATSNDHIDPASNKLGGQGRQPIEIPLSPAVFDRHILTLRISVLSQASAERGDKIGSRTGRAAVEEANNGLYTAEAVAMRQAIRELLRDSRESVELAR
jgi:hypothetical protein